MVIESVVTSLAVGKIRKRKILNIGMVQIKAWYFFIMALVLEVSANLYVAYNKSEFVNYVYNYFILIHLASYILVFIGLYKNRDKKSMWFIFIGTFLNFICIMANKGQMPISLDGLKMAGLVPADAINPVLDLTHTLANENTKLSFLADIIAMPKIYPLAKVVSIGDIILEAGIFVFLQEAMKEKVE